MRFFVAMLVGAALLSPPARAAAPEPGADVLAELYPQYNGLPVGKITVTGLRRSREAIVRWMLGAREGEPFDAQAWQAGIEHLYKTESVYGVHTAIEKRDGRLWIALSLQDKWTLFPYLDFQGGGGALSVSAGIYDSNLLGTFTHAWVGAGYLNREYSYEIGLFQKWFLQTTYSLGLYLSDKDFPVTLQDSGGTRLQSFTWARRRRALSVGKQNGERLYWEIGLESFTDRLHAPNPRTATFLYPDKAQARLSPSVRFWRVAHSDYLEQGRELTLAASTANPLQPALAAYSATVTWKQVFFLPDTRNLAYFVSLGHMTPAPLAYQFRLGGFDSVRGFSMNRAFGLDVGRANFEVRSTLLTWRVPFLDIDRMVLQSCAFTDAGAAWNSAGIDQTTGKNTQRDTRLLYSAGAGLRAIFLHFADATARLDFAKAIYPQEGWNLAFGVGQFF